MKCRNYLAAIVLAASCCFPAFSQTISIGITSPLPASLAADAVQVRVSVQSTYEVTAVQASTEGRRADLVYSPAMARWTNVISLEGLARGPKILTLTASDVLGNSTQTSVTFLLDRPPRLTVLEPLNQSVARPHLRVGAHVEDDGPSGCEISVFIGNTYDLRLGLSGTNAVSGSVTWSLPSILSPEVWFHAVDSAGQSVWVGRTIAVETSTNLTEVFAAPGALLDVTPDAALYYTTEDITGPTRPPETTYRYRQPSVKFRSPIITGNDVVLPLVTNHSPDYAVITGPNSALITYAKEHSSVVPFFELNGNVVRTLADSVAGVSYAGGRVAFDSDGIHLRDLVNQSDLYYGPGRNPRLAENGTYLFAGAGNGLFQSRSLNPPEQTPRTNVMLLPLGVRGYDGNGTNVVYHWLQTLTNYQLVILTPTGEDSVTSPQAFGAFTVNAGWVAYNKAGASGQMQVWTRSPDGVHQQRTLFSASSTLESLNSNGELTFIDSAPPPGNRYLSVPGVPQPIRISSRAGRVKWINGDLHIMLGRSLFRPVYGDVTLARANASEWRVRFQGLQGLHHQLQVSSNLLDWANLTSFTNTTGIYEYLDGNNAQRRYYRTVLDTR